MNVNDSIRLIQEAVREDLETCGTALRGDQKDQATAALERAIAKLDMALDRLGAVSNPE